MIAQPLKVYQLPPWQSEMHDVDISRSDFTGVDINTTKQSGQHLQSKRAIHYNLAQLNTYSAAIELNYIKTNTSYLVDMS